MNILLIRNYLRNGTNGLLYMNGQLLCETIELPWKENMKQKSCIPEGTYPLMKRYSQKFGWHLEVLNVPNRSLILIPPANDAQKELRGCIAPVSQTTGEGKGLSSRKAFKIVRSLLFPVLDQKQSVYITITH